VLAVGCGVAVLHTINSSTIVDGAHAALQNAATLSFVAISARNWRRASGRARVTWLLIAVFSCCLATAQVDWTIRGFESGPTGHDLWSDTLYASSMPFGIVGLVTLAFSDLRRGQHLRVITDALVVASGLGLLHWAAFLAEPVGNGVFAGRLLTLVVPFLDVVAAAVIITASIYQPHRPSLRWLAAVISASALSDTLVALHVAPGGHTVEGGVLLVTWFLGPMLLTIAAVGTIALAYFGIETEDEEATL